MARLSARISNAMTGVKCPACEKYVTPKIASAEPDANEAGAPGQVDGRWSFVWRPPSGEICPECNFPLGRYARRAKWMRLFGVGVVVLTLAFLLNVLGKMAELPAWYGWIPKALAILGLLAFVGGLVGLVVGGRRSDSGQVPSQ